MKAYLEHQVKQGGEKIMAAQIIYDLFFSNIHKISRGRIWRVNIGININRSYQKAQYPQTLTIKFEPKANSKLLGKTISHSLTYPCISR